MPAIGDLLPENALGKLRDEYLSDDMVEILSGTLPKLYHESQPYVAAIEKAFFNVDVPDDWAPPPREVLSVQDRERVIIGMLAARGSSFFLALHIYIALMEWVSPAEIAHILLLAGVYTGVDNLSHGIGVHATMLRTLAAHVEAGSDLKVPAIYTLLRGTFPG